MKVSQYPHLPQTGHICLCPAIDAEGVNKPNTSLMLISHTVDRVAIFFGCYDNFFLVKMLFNTTNIAELLAPKLFSRERLRRRNRQRRQLPFDARAAGWRP